MLKIVGKQVKENCLNDCFIFQLISNTNLLEEMEAKEKEEKEWKKMSEKNAKISKMQRKQNVRKKFQSDTDEEEDDKIVEVEEEEESDEEENTDEHKGQPIYFEEERENLQPITEFLGMELCLKILCPTNKEEIFGKWFACIP